MKKTSRLPHITFILFLLTGLTLAAYTGSQALWKTMETYNGRDPSLIIKSNIKIQTNTTGINGVYLEKTNKPIQHPPECPDNNTQTYSIRLDPYNANKPIQPEFLPHLARSLRACWYNTSQYLLTQDLAKKEAQALETAGALYMLGGLISLILAVKGKTRTNRTLQIHWSVLPVTALVVWIFTLLSPRYPVFTPLYPGWTACLAYVIGLAVGLGFYIGALTYIIINYYVN